MAETAPKDEQKYIMNDDMYDHKGNRVIVASNTGDLRTPADITNALIRYNDSEGQKMPEGFVILPYDSYQAYLRKSF